MEDLCCWQSNFKSCPYSDRLINKIILLNKRTNNKVDLHEIKKAIYYAKKYHGNQKRQTGEPYYSHPLEVAYQISNYRFKTDVLITSILHDTLEDSELTKEMIEYIFGNTIANHVDDLTRIKTGSKISISENIKALYLAKKYDLLLIKIFDRLHNLQTITVKPIEKIKKIIHETLTEFIILSIYLGKLISNMAGVEEEITKLCYQNLKYLDTITKTKQYGPPIPKMTFSDHFQLIFPNFQNDTIQINSQNLSEPLPLTFHNHQNI